MRKRASATVKRPSRAAIQREMEATNFESQPGELVSARRAYRDDLTQAEQWNLAYELVDTRKAELCRAYKSVVGVRAGYLSRTPKKKSKSQKGQKQADPKRVNVKPRLIKTPGAVFLVRHKWTDQRREPEGQRIPRFLFAYWTVEGKRILCAVPTDVLEADKIVAFSPENGVVVRPSGVRGELGTLTCQVKRSTKPGNSYLLSCRHVFGMTTRRHPRTNSSAPVFERNSSRLIANVVSVRGELVAGRSDCVDAQLALVKNTQLAGKAFQNIRISEDDFIRSRSSLPTEYYIHAPNRTNPVRATKIGYDSDVVVPYPVFDGSGRIRTEMLRLAAVIYSRTGHGSSPTVQGDSGSPITSGRGGGSLVAIHIGKNEAGEMMAIPAWIFLNPEYFPAISGTGEIWTLMAT